MTECYTEADRNELLVYVGMYTETDNCCSLFRHSISLSKHTHKNVIIMDLLSFHFYTDFRLCQDSFDCHRCYSSYRIQPTQWRHLLNQYSHSAYSSPVRSFDSRSHIRYPVHSDQHSALRAVSGPHPSLPPPIKHVRAPQTVFAVPDMPTFPHQTLVDFATAADASATQQQLLHVHNSCGFCEESAVPVLEAYLAEQVQASSVDVDANLALLKLYQLYPSTLKAATVATVLIKGVMALPSTFFTGASTMVPESIREVRESSCFAVLLRRDGRRRV